MFATARLFALTLLPWALLPGQSGDLPGPDRLELIIRMRAEDPGTRIAALAAAGTRLAGRSDLVLQGILRRLSSDPNPEVRYQVAVSLGQTGSGRPELKRYAEQSLGELLIHSAGSVRVRAAAVQASGVAAGTILLDLLADPRFQANQKGRGGVLLALTEAILLRRNPDAMTGVLESIAGRDAGWQRQALLTGLLLNLPGGSETESPLLFPYKPRALDRMLESEEAQVKQAGERILAVSEWTDGVRPLDRDESALYARGENLFGLNCLSCHQADGMGTPTLAPPLVGSEWVLGSEERLVRVLTAGLTGPVTVAGKRYQMVGMVGFPRMDEEQIAALITYVRRTWGNEGDPITPDEVARIRAEIGDHSGQWTEAELSKYKE